MRAALLYDVEFGSTMRFSPASFRGGSGCAKNAHANGKMRGSAAPALLLFICLLVFVAITVYLFATGFYAPPPPITRVGLQIDHQYELTLYVTGAAFILAQLGLGWAVFRFRDRGKPASFTHGHVGLEIAWTVVTAVAFLGLGALATGAWSQTRFQSAAAGAIQVEVTEEQFVYHFRYPGKDGKFGRIDPALISAPTGNPLGIDPNDPAGRDDIVVSTLTVPVNHPVELLIRSQDVIHNFFVRELRLQQDAVPGMVVPLHFTPDRIGRYDIMCTQLCGMGHNQMHSFLNVVSEVDYQKFLAHAPQP
ncbi:MAG: cytochrome c oxidase subunit II [Candidatus Acidiferrales bacterium]